MKRSRVFKLLAAGTVGAALLVGGFVIASNIGVKLIYPLNYSGTLNGNDFLVSLPFVSPLSIADDLLKAAPGATKVTRFDPSIPKFIVWFPGVDAVNNFQIVPGEGYIISIPKETTTSSITFVGAHDPARVYNYNVSGLDFFVSIPYHTVWQDLDDIFKATPHAQFVTRLEPSTNFKLTWFPGGIAANNSPVVIGEGYMVRVSSTPSVSVPEHF
jgi:hypothetical protein